MNTTDDFGGRWDAARLRDRPAGKRWPTYEQFRETLSEHFEPWLDGQLGVTLHKSLEVLGEPLKPDTAREAAERLGAALWITVDARLVMAKEIARCGDVEIAWILFRVSDTQFGRPVVSTRGSKDMTIHLYRDMEPGCLLLHNHPEGNTSPSESDIKALAALLSPVKAGFDLAYGIINDTADRLFLMRDPRPVEQPAEEESTDATD